MTTYTVQEVRDTGDVLAIRWEMTRHGHYSATGYRDITNKPTPAAADLPGLQYFDTPSTCYWIDHTVFNAPIVTT